jgi:hypothetical protein
VAVNDQRVTSIMPALEAHYGIHLTGQQVNYLSLALVTPLGAQHDYAFCHFNGYLG